MILRFSAETPRPGPFCPKTAGGRAFTVLELLVASAIAILVLGMIAGVFSGVIGQYQQTVSRLVTEIDAAVALDLVAKDLESLALVNQSPAERLQALPEAAPSPSLTAKPVWLMLLSDPMDSNDPAKRGQTRAISYRVGYSDPIAAGGERKSFVLFRAIKDARETFASVAGQTNSHAEYWSKGGTTSTDVSEFLVGNVVGFQIVFWAQESPSSSTLTRIPPTSTVRITGGGYTVDGVTRPGRILRAEVTLTLLAPGGASRLQAGGITPEEAIKKFGYTYSRMVNLRAQKL